MTIYGKMKALADELRSLSATSELMGLDDMQAHTAQANDQVLEQTALIRQIQAALQNVGGGDGLQFQSNAQGAVPIIQKGTAQSTFTIRMTSNAIGS